MKNNLKNLNFLLLILMIAYSILGIVMILSASLLAGILSLLTSLAGLPEVGDK